MSHNINAPPLNPLPWVVWALALPMVAVELVVSLGARGLVGGPGAIGWRLDAVQRFAFAPDLWRQMLELGSYPVAGLARLGFPDTSQWRIIERLSFLGAAIEVFQSSPALNRDCDVWDWAADTLAAAVMVIVLTRLIARRTSAPAPAHVPHTPG